MPPSIEILPELLIASIEPKTRVPLFKSTPPENVLVPLRFKELTPNLINLPVPEIGLANVKSPPPLIVSVLLILIEFTDIFVVLKIALSILVKLAPLIVPAKVAEDTLLISPIVALVVRISVEANPEIFPAVNAPVLTIKFSLADCPDIFPVTMAVALGLVIVTSELSTTLPVK